MSLKLSHSLLACTLTALLLGGCKREEPSPTDTPQAAAPVEAAADATASADAADTAALEGTDAISAVPTTQAEAGVQPAVVTIAGVEPRDFAGTFAGDGTDLTLNADGTYAMSMPAESADAKAKSMGTWTVEAGGNELLLDSEDKAEPDQRYVVTSKDELKASEGGQALHRAVSQ